jgi:hypothetical protein
MSEESQTIALVAGQYEKLGVVHCSISKQGQVSVAGDVVTLDDGESHVFTRGRVAVKRAGDDYQFSKIA